MWCSAVSRTLSAGDRFISADGHPQYLDTEMHTAPVGAITADTLWPEPVVQDLKVRFFAEAAEQTGTITSNDYINGDLHDFFRKKLFDNYGAIPNHVPLTELAGLHQICGSQAAGPTEQSTLSELRSGHQARCTACRSD